MTTERELIERTPEARLARLEGEAVRLRRWLTVACVGVVALLVHALWPARPSVAFFERDGVEVRDADGRVRARLGLDGAGGALELFDAQERVVARLAAGSVGGDLLLGGERDLRRDAPDVLLSGWRRSLRLGATAPSLELAADAPSISARAADGAAVGGWFMDAAGQVRSLTPAPPR
ncbi:MAG: hypothetical protein U1F43_12035 [Myxococcota bacterium]